MIHIPILRQGTPYKSIDIARAPHYRTRETFVEMSQANAGLIRRDLLKQDKMRAALTAFTTEQLLAMCKAAAEYYLHETRHAFTDSKLLLLLTQSELSGRLFPLGRSPVGLLQFDTCLNGT